MSPDAFTGLPPEQASSNAALSDSGSLAGAVDQYIIMEAAREARESLEEADRDAAALASGKITAAKDMTANMHTFKYDKKMTSCEGCSKKFTTFLRRHHCRGCRGAYCHYCSKKKIEASHPCPCPFTAIGRASFFSLHRARRAGPTVERYQH